MKILLLSFYYPPDLCPGSFRAASMVDGLLGSMPAGAHIDVVTTMPNRYSSFAQQAPALEQHERLSIRRIALPPHRSGMWDQSKAFLSFARGVRAHLRGHEYDVIVATSSRLMTAVLGAWAARRQPDSKLYLDIRDIFVDTIKDVLPRRVALLTKTGFSLLEGWAIGRAHTVNLISPGFAGYFRDRYPAKRYSFFTNGIDQEFLAQRPGEVSPVPAGQPVTILYAGNIGEGQGLHLIVPELAARLQGRARFVIVGDGGRMEALRAAVSARGLDNVSLLAPMKRSELVAMYQAADVLFVHLNDYEAFKKVLPSKLFEYGAMGKPIWAGVAGYAAQFAQDELSNTAVFAPCDADAALRAFDQLAIGHAERSGFIQKFQRDAIAREMARDILAGAA